MKVILLPGMDGTGILFEPLLKELPEGIDAQVVSYSCDTKQSYEQLIRYVKSKLPESEDFVLVSESFSGPIGYAIATNPPGNLKAVVFVATFINSPNNILWLLGKLPLALLLKIPIPVFIIKRFLLGSDVESHTVSLLINSLKAVKSSVLAFRIREMAKLKGGEKPIGMRCVYILAKNDRLVSRGHSGAFRKLAQKMEVAEISGPHFIMQARPKECAQLLKKYVAL